MSSVVSSYVTFTVFSQMSVGALLVMVIADFLAKGKEDEKFFETGAWVSVPAIIISLVGILAHEARPGLAMTTMYTNLATSWLSREVLAFLAFVILAVIYSVRWLMEPEYGSLKKFPGIPWIVGKLISLRKPVGVLAIIIGFAFLGVSARAYMMTGLPALNQPTTPLFFFVTALLTGVTATVAVLSVKYLVKRENGESLARMLPIMMGIVLAMLIILIVGLLVNTSMLKVAETEYAMVAQEETLKIMQEGMYATLYLARWVVGVGLALIFTVGLALPLKKKSMRTASALTISLFIVVLIGEILGRTVLFGTSVPLGHVMPNIEAFYAGIGL